MFLKNLCFKFTKKLKIKLKKMTEEKTETEIKESRPMSANNPLRRQKNNVSVKHGNPKKSYLSEKENEQLNKLTKKQKVLNQLNSPFKKEMKDFFGEKTITSKNLLSEIKQTRTKTHLQLPKIQNQSSGTALPGKRKTMKLGIIDANKGANNENNQRNKLEINCGINRQNNTGIILLDTQKEKGKLNTIRKNSFYKSKNNKSIDKINITINQKKKVKETDDIKNLKKTEGIKNFNFNININNKKNINTINNKSINKEQNELKKSKENNNINNDNVINCKKNILNNNNKRNNYIEVTTKNSIENKNKNVNNTKTNSENNNKMVKFNKEVSIINILKDSNENLEIQRNSISFSKDKEILNENSNTKDVSNNINNNISNINNINSFNIENSSIEVKFISNININTNTSNININENSNDNNGNKYNNIVKNSANSNKNLSEISEQINTNLSTSKIEPFQEVILLNNNGNKNNAESSSDKNCGLIQSLSNNIETDHYLHKTINCNNSKILLGEIIYESPRSVIYKGLDLNTGEIICAKRYIDKNETEELKREIELFELINKEQNENNNINNIIKYYGFNTQDDGNFIFLEYAIGDNLKKIIKLYGGSLNENLIRNYL